MKSGPALDDLVAVIIETCRAGLEPDALRAAVLPRLRRAVPVDALWWATVDPATLLYTQAHREELPSDTGTYFVENEFLRDDVNKWTALAGDRSGVRTLAAATDGKLELSPRYRDIFEPLGLADELRAVFVWSTGWDSHLELRERTVLRGRVVERDAHRRYDAAGRAATDRGNRVLGGQAAALRRQYLRYRDSALRVLYRHVAGCQGRQEPA